MRKLKLSDIKEYIETNSECKLLSTEYKDVDTPISLKCGTCGEPFNVAFKYFKMGKMQCNQCGHNNGGRKQAKTTEQFAKEVEELTNGEFEVFGEYITQYDNVDFLHKVCNTKFSMRPNNFLNGQRCIKCSRGIKNHEEYLKEFIELSGGEFVLLGKYVNQRTKILAKHNICGHEFKFFPSHIRTKKHIICPVCEGYLGEIAITKWFKLNHIEYIPQYPVLGRLRVDFATIKDNKLIFIEYQGEQHYKPVNFGGVSIEQSEDNFKKGKLNDAMKVDYCKENDIELIEIPYWDFDNINSILDDKILN